MPFIEEFGKEQSNPDADAKLTEKERLEKSLKLADSQLHEQLFILGRLYYEMNVDKPDSELYMYIDEITKTQQLIERISSQLARMKNLRRCVHCLAEFPADLPRCPECGASAAQHGRPPVPPGRPRADRRPNQPPRTIAPGNPPEPNRWAPPPEVVCPRCGMRFNDPTVRFCLNCGTKIRKHNQ